MHHLIYVFDSYCGWCYGFGPAIRERAARDDIFVEVRHGSLFGGDRAASLGAFAHIPQANARIAALTGARFGDGYQRLLESGEVSSTPTMPPAAWPPCGRWSAPSATWTPPAPSSRRSTRRACRCRRRTPKEVLMNGATGLEIG